MKYGFDYVLENDFVLGIIAVIVILITEWALYSQNRYYSFDMSGERKEKHILNLKYNFNSLSKKKIDVKKINKYVLISHLIIFFIAIIVMAAVDVIYGFIVYAVGIVFADPIVYTCIGKNKKSVMYK